LARREIDLQRVVAPAAPGRARFGRGADAAHGAARAAARERVEAQVHRLALGKEQAVGLQRPGAHADAGLVADHLAHARAGIGALALGIATAAPVAEAVHHHPGRAGAHLGQPRLGAGEGEVELDLAHLQHAILAPARHRLVRGRRRATLGLGITRGALRLGLEAVVVERRALVARHAGIQPRAFRRGFRLGERDVGLHRQHLEVGHVLGRGGHGGVALHFQGADPVRAVTGVDAQQHVARRHPLALIDESAQHDRR